MPTLDEAHVKGFRWFATGWLLAVVGSSIVAVVSGDFQWTRVVRAALSLGVAPIISASLVVASRKWLGRPQD